MMGGRAAALVAVLLIVSSTCFVGSHAAQARLLLHSHMMLDCWQTAGSLQFRDFASISELRVQQRCDVTVCGLTRRNMSESALKFEQISSLHEGGKTEAIKSHPRMCLLI